MAVAALTVHPGFFASGAACAGLAYGERATAVSGAYGSGGGFRSISDTVTSIKKARKNDLTPTPLFIVHSHDAKTVDMQAAKNLRDSWLTYFGLEQKVNRKTQYKREKNISWTPTRYSRLFRKSLVETLFLEGPGHGWCGGEEGDFSYPDGPNISKMMWKLSRQHTL